MKKGLFELWSLRHAAADGIKFKNAFSKRGTWHFPFTQFNVHKYVSNLHFTIVRMLKMGTIYVRGFCYLEFLTVFQKVYGDVYFENIRCTKFTTMNVWILKSREMSFVHFVLKAFLGCLPFFPSILFFPI